MGWVLASFSFFRFLDATEMRVVPEVVATGCQAISERSSPVPEVHCNTAAFVLHFVRSTGYTPCPPLRGNSVVGTRAARQQPHGVARCAYPR
jgi:hypothetical protein